MLIALHLLKKQEKGIIKEINLEEIPMKLIELGCLPESEVSVFDKAPMNDPIYLNINGVHLAIREEVARHILVEKIDLNEK